MILEGVRIAAKRESIVSIVNSASIAEFNGNPTRCHLRMLWNSLGGVVWTDGIGGDNCSLAMLPQGQSGANNFVSVGVISKMTPIIDLDIEQVGDLITNAYKVSNTSVGSIVIVIETFYRF